MAALQGQARETLDELSVEEVFAQRLSSETLDDAQQAPLLALYRQVVGELREGEA
ncbi:exonuclease subunit SbcD [compost metagenome]